MKLKTSRLDEMIERVQTRKLLFQAEHRERTEELRKYVMKEAKPAQKLYMDGLCAVMDRSARSIQRDGIAPDGYEGTRAFWLVRTVRKLLKQWGCV